MSDRETILAQLNNEGAMYLRENRYGDAVRVYKVAMTLGIRLVNHTSQIGSKLEICDGDHDHDEQSHDSFEQEAYNKMYQIRRHAQHHMSSLTEKHQPTTAHSSMSSTSEDCEMNGMDNNTSYDFIYREPIRFLDRYDSPSHAELILTIVFNLALSYHLKALHNSQKKLSKRHLLKAMKLYKFASMLESTHQICLAPSHSVAMLNNVAQIYKAAGRDEKADRMFHKLLSTIALIVDNGASSFVDEIDGFVQNVSHLILKETHIALAA